MDEVNRTKHPPLRLTISGGGQFCSWFISALHSQQAPELWLGREEIKNCCWIYLETTTLITHELFTAAVIFFLVTGACDPNGCSRPVKVELSVSSLLSAIHTSETTEHLTSLGL